MAPGCKLVVDEMGQIANSVDEMELDELGLDEMGLNRFTHIYIFYLLDFASSIFPGNAKILPGTYLRLIYVPDTTEKLSKRPLSP